MASRASVGSDAHASRVIAAAGESASLHIRFATRDAHEALERTTVVRRLMSPYVCAGEYLQVLDAWLQVWAPLEALLVRAHPCGLDASRMPLPRVVQLRQDMCDVRAAMGQEAAGAGLLAPAGVVRRLNELEVLVSVRPGWMGLAYVLQGSMLGRSVVASHLRRALPQDLAHCTRFFSPSSQESHGLASEWRLWLQWFDRQLSTPSEQLQASGAAVRVFEFLACAWTVQDH